MTDYSSPAPPPPPVTPTPSTPQDVIYPSAPPKDPALAVILNVFASFLSLSGAGYFYIGQWQKAIVAILTGWMLLLMTVLLMSVCIGVFLLPVCVAYVVLLAVDIHRQTSLLRAGTPIGQWTFFSAHK
jgi:TM2 domain-containing membrane protein YozV